MKWKKYFSNSFQLLFKWQFYLLFILFILLFIFIYYLNDRQFYSICLWNRSNYIINMSKSPLNCSQCFWSITLKDFYIWMTTFSIARFLSLFIVKLREQIFLQWIFFSIWIWSIYDKPVKCWIRLASPLPLR